MNWQSESGITIRDSSSTRPVARVRAIHAAGILLIPSVEHDVVNETTEMGQVAEQEHQTTQLEASNFKDGVRIQTNM